MASRNLHRREGAVLCEMITWPLWACLWPLSWRHLVPTHLEDLLWRLNGAKSHPVRGVGGWVGLCSATILQPGDCTVPNQTADSMNCPLSHPPPPPPRPSFRGDGGSGLASKACCSGPRGYLWHTGPYIKVQQGAPRKQSMNTWVTFLLQDYKQSIFPGMWCIQHLRNRWIVFTNQNICSWRSMSRTVVGYNRLIKTLIVFRLWC